MKFKPGRTRSCLSVVSRDTRLWVVGVIVGAIILSVSFYLEPLNKDFFAQGKNVSAAEKEASDPEVYNISTKLSDRTGDVASDNSNNALEVVTVSTDTDYAVSMDEYDKLCKIVTAEANTEDIKGQILIANVVMNRVASSKYPNSIEEVILQNGQFQPVTSGAFDYIEPTSVSREAVVRALNGEDYSEGALYFQKSAATEWGGHEYLFRYGNHSFYK